MTNSEMKKQVIEMFLENVPELEGIEIANDTMLISSGYVDSFSVIKMIALFEDAFSVTRSIMRTSRRWTPSWTR